LEQYYSRLVRLEGCALLTAETYLFEIRCFLVWLEKEAYALETVDMQALSRYLEKRRTLDGIGSRSVSKAITVLRSFFRFAIDEQIRPDNPAVFLEAPRKGAYLPAVLAQESILQLFSMIDTHTLLGIRDRALYELLYAAGLRISEALAVDLGDIMFSKRLIRVKGKGSKERLAIFGDQAAFWLNRYLTKSRPLLAGLEPNPALFISKTGKRLSRKGVWKNYAKAAEAAGVSSKLHTLRHTFATELLAGGADLRSVQELLGHTALTTTQVYTHLDVSLLQENHRQYMPGLSDYNKAMEDNPEINIGYEH
jgi:integrase/recombinase XerD